METQAPAQRTVDVNTVSGLALTAILNMPEFTGDPERLADFLEAASAAGAHLRSVNTLLPPEVVNNIYGILIRKISHQVRAECGITGSTEAAEVARLLSERYGGARRPPARSAIKLLRMRRAHGETPSAYMHHVDQAFRLVKARMAAVEAAGVATAKLAVIEELLREAVLAEMPENTRRQLKALTNANFGVLLAQVDEEEDDYQAAREDAATWTRVERRSERRPDRGHERRAPPNPPPQVRREQPARFRPAGDQRRGERRERLRCWVCGSTRHLARSCPRGRASSSTGTNGVQHMTTRQTRTGPCSLNGRSDRAGRQTGGYRGLPVRPHPTPVRRASQRGPLVKDSRETAGGQAGRIPEVKGRVTLKSYVGAAVVRERGLITRANVHEHFGEVFHREGEFLSATGRVRHEIVIPDDRVVYVKPRRYPQALTEVLEKEVRDLLAQGIIRKSVSPYFSPLWVVPKTPDAQGNPRYRVVVDFKELNKYTRPEK
ncbi:hypothetical protein AAG570_012436 [Ranatra chinensis]|uniref:CCHC-type domain-containing protein n=1 Tax=Ranatra chinensis TaxID=642074 RepID=A0ABD0YDU8_9HEMI